MSAFIRSTAFGVSVTAALLRRPAAFNRDEPTSRITRAVAAAIDANRIWRLQASMLHKYACLALNVRLKIASNF